MRRPIAMLGLAFVLILLGIVSYSPHRPKTYADLDREQVTVVGSVEWKEYKQTGGERTLVVSLEHVMVLKPEKVSALEQITSQSDKASNFYDFINAGFFEKNRKEHKTVQDELCLEGTEEIRGILCYLEQKSTTGEKLPKMGSLVLVEGKFRAMRQATNPGEFDAAVYYQTMGQQGRLMNGRILVQGEETDHFRERLYQLREYLGLLLDACYPEKDAAVMRAMLLGEKGLLYQDTKELYQQNGIIHILSISGLHISLLGMGFYKLLRKARIPLKAGAALSLLFMFCYGSMTGMGVSVVRAFVMFAFHMAAQMAGRTYDMLTAMAVAAVLLLLSQPLYLEHSGFLFSFCAVCGIGTVLPAAQENYLWKCRPLENFCGGIVISACTLPVYLCYYYEFPPFSVLLNLVVIPGMTVVLVSGILTVLTGVWAVAIGKIVCLPGSLILFLYEKLCALCAGLPGHTWITGCPAIWQIVFFTCLLSLAVYISPKAPKLFFWMLFMVALRVLVPLHQNEFDIHMVDVGQGDCIYVHTLDDRSFLIDGGSTDRKEVERYQILPFLKYQGTDRLEFVLVTHPDSDHMNGILEMLEDYETNGITIGTLLLPDIAEECQNENYLLLLQKAAEKGIPVHRISAGEKIRIGEVMLTCMHPQKKGSYNDTNAESVVLHLRYGQFTALFTGDLEGEGERQLLEELEKQKVSLLKVAHHGSSGATSQEFLDRIAPSVAIISCGQDNSYGHPHAETLQRLENAGAGIYVTKSCGAITVKADRKGRFGVSGYIR